MPPPAIRGRPRIVNPNSRPNSTHHRRYATRSIHTIVKDAGSGAGVPGNHFAHKWRHTYATSLLRRGVDVHKVQRLLGHGSLAITERYLHLVIDDLADAVNAAFPASHTPPVPPEPTERPASPSLTLIAGGPSAA